MAGMEHRRDFLKQTLAAGAAWGIGTLPHVAAASEEEAHMERPFEISLAEWSLHKALQQGKLDNLDFAATARNDFEIGAIEYVNQFFKDKAEDQAYLAQLNARAQDADVKQLLIMVDGEGQLGDADDAARKQAVENHYRWVTAAKELGCHSIRVNAASSGSYEEQMQRAADGLRQLCEFAAGHDLNILVENHGGLSSNGAWLAGVMKQVDLPNCGTLPDFGNFHVGDGEWYDRYVGVEELMPYAKAVSAKSHAFDEEGNETNTDYLKMMKIVVDAGYHGYVGIEWEGDGVDEWEGIRLTQTLLERVREELSS
ncbi:MAG: sugar phosphate isomerase/epimerase family protein [Planctomycetota bacterium]